MTLNSFFATLVLVSVVLFCFSKIPHLYFELTFYWKSKWNLRLDSGCPIWKQNSFLARFPFLPFGLVKLLVLGNQVTMGIALVVWYISG